MFKYLTDMKLQAVQQERVERLQMLKRLCGKQTKQPRSTREEVDKLLEIEKQRTDIICAIFIKLQSEKMNRTIYDEVILPDKIDEPEYEVISMITIKRLKEQTTTAKPINLNLTIDGNKVSRNIMFVEENDIVVPEDVSRIQRTTPEQEEGENNENNDIDTQKNEKKIKSN